jgi:hypothetical protein
MAGERMLVPIGWYLSPSEAYIVRSRLEADGIFAAVVHDRHLTMNWSVALAIGGAKVMVATSDREAADAVLRKGESGELAKALKAELGDLGETRCPRCDQGDFTSQTATIDIIVTLLALTVAIPIPLRADHHVCRACGSRWRGL